MIKEHEDAFDPEHPKDMIDYYLQEMRNTEGPMHKKIFQDRKPMDQLEQIVLDLFSAGVETLKTSLLWSVVYMLHNPKVLLKVQEELDAVVGKERLPDSSMMANLPYTRATLYEIMRCASVVPMGTTHSNSR